MINLSQMIHEGNLGSYLGHENIFDAIISDIPLSAEIPPFSNKKHLHLGNGVDIEQVTQFVRKEKIAHPLIISSYLGIQEWIPIISLLDRYTLINAFTGIGSFRNKHSPELDDIKILHQHKQTPLYIFPSDEESFIYALEYKAEKKYLRLSNNYLAFNKYQRNGSDEMEEIGFVEQKLISNHYLLALKEQARTQATILFSGELFAQAVTVHALAEEERKNRDILVIDIFEKAQIQERIQHSLKQSKNLILVSDQTPDSAKLVAADYLDSNCSFTALSPHYDQLSTLLEDYQYQQAGFEGQEIYQRLSQLLG